MQSNILNTIYDAVSNEWRTALGQLKDLSKILRNTATDQEALIIANVATIINIAGDRTSYATSQAVITDRMLADSVTETCSNLEDIAEAYLTDANDVIHVLRNGESSIVLESDTFDFNYTLNVNGDQVSIYSGEELAEAENVCSDLVTSVRNTVVSTAKGKAVNVGLADLVDTCTALYEGAGSYTDLSANGQAFLAVKDKLSALEFSDQEKSVWLTAVLAGPKGVIDAVTSFIQRSEDTAQEGSLDLPTTSLVYKRFACGIILGAVSGVVTAIGLTVFGISRVLSVVLTAVGAVLNAAGQIVRNISEALTGASFDFSSEGFHAFDFAIFKGSMSFEYVANLIRLRGFNRITMLDPRSNLVWFFALKYPLQENRNEVLYEAHLSTDFDWNRRLEFHAANTINVPGKQVLITNPCFTLNDVDPSTGTQIPRFFMYGLSSIGHATATNKVCNFMIPAVAQDISGSLFDIWSGGSYSPCDLGSAVNLRKIFSVSNSIEIAAAVRFASACMGLGSYLARKPITNLFRADWNLGEGYDFVGITIPGGLSLYNPVTAGVALFQEGFRCLCALWSTSSASVGGRRSDIDRSDADIYSIFQNLFELCAACFDGLRLDLNAITYNIIAGSRSLTWNSGSAIGELYYTAQEVSNIYLGAISNCSTIISYAGENFVTDDWPTKWLIQLPKITWSAYVAGLFVDGLLLLVATGLIITGVIVSNKLRNYRSRMQAATEEAWYSYGEMTDGVKDDGTAYTEAEMNAAWKNYKRSRFKYNIIASITGGTTLSMGLYDDYEDGEGIVSKLGNLLGGSGDDESVNLNDIRVLISGE